jgi:hypothetical protein
LLAATVLLMPCGCGGDGTEYFSGYVTVEIANGRFYPYSIEATSGWGLVIVNNDGRRHMITADDFLNDPIAPGAEIRKRLPTVYSTTTITLNLDRTGETCDVIVYPEDARPKRQVNARARGTTH